MNVIGPFTEGPAYLLVTICDEAYFNVLIFVRQVYTISVWHSSVGEK